MTAELGPRPTRGEWLAGARPRTLPAAISPVLVGSGAAYLAGGFSPPRALLALLVSLALQVGVNYANDYSDGIRGTDADRIGPMRLVGSGLAEPSAVKRAAFGCFGVAAVAGLLLVALSGQWWLLLVGAVSILAAWYYTGGRRPYGYLGLGEVFVFVFFGLVAVCGTTLVQVGRVTMPALLGGIGIGAMTCAILVANNLRDIVGDVAARKRTLATRIGAPATRTLYAALVVVAALSIVAIGLVSTSWALLGLLGLLLVIPAVRTVLTGGVGPALVVVLKATGTSELAAAALLTAGLVIGTVR